MVTNDLGLCQVEPFKAATGIVLKIMGRTEQKNVGACVYLVERKVKCGPGVEDARGGDAYPS